MIPNLSPRMLLLAAALLLACGVETGRAQWEVRRALPAESSWDERARFLAGLPLEGISVLAPLQSTGWYLAHTQEYGTLWRRFMREHFGPKRMWAWTEKGPLTPRQKTLFYLFSGPDLINAAALFPECEEFLLVALEPPGQMPAPETLPDEAVINGLENLRESTKTTLEFSYFITKEMRERLERSEFRGVLPVLLAFAARAGWRVEEVLPVSINRLGVPVEGHSAGGLPGWCLRARDSAGNNPRTVWYIRADLADAAATRASAGLWAWLNNKGEGAGYLKAASYLLHEAAFSRSRDFLLTRCRVLLQDDSGIPLRFFSPDRWALYFFGTYTRPIELFAARYQPDLEKAYRDSWPRPLPFGTGYQFRPGESNLMLAVRRDAARAWGLSGHRP